MPSGSLRRARKVIMHLLTNSAASTSLPESDFGLEEDSTDDRRYFRDAPEPDLPGVVIAHARHARE